MEAKPSRPRSSCPNTAAPRRQGQSRKRHSLRRALLLPDTMSHDEVGDEPARVATTTSTTPALLLDASSGHVPAVAALLKGGAKRSAISETIAPSRTEQIASMRAQSCRCSPQASSGSATTAATARAAEVGAGAGCRVSWVRVLDDPEGPREAKACRSRRVCVQPVAGSEGARVAACGSRVFVRHSSQGQRRRRLVDWRVPG